MLTSSVFRSTAHCRKRPELSRSFFHWPSLGANIEISWEPAAVVSLDSRYLHFHRVEFSETIFRPEPTNHHNFFQAAKPFFFEE
jgi:hypothetical protein